MQVIVVPEKMEFIEDTAFNNEVYISKKLGIPRIIERNVRYLVPLWLNQNPTTADRVYHILETNDHPDYTGIVLGNSFIVKPKWNNMGSHRKYEYHDLSTFGLKEIKAGLLDKI